MNLFVDVIDRNAQSINACRSVAPPIDPISAAIFPHQTFDVVFARNACARQRSTHQFPDSSHCAACRAGAAVDYVDMRR